MLKKQTLGLITLIKSAIDGKKYDLPDEFDIDNSYSIIAFHKIQSLAYMGAVNCGIDADLPAMKKLFLDTCAYVSQSTRQGEAIDELIAAFEKNGIKYMPVKGTLIKDLYPQPDMRYMSDADIVIDTNQYKIIKPLLTDLGYEEEAESLCELIWHKQQLHLELHKMLIPPNIPDYYRYYGKGFSKGKPVSETRYELSDEDHYVFIFTHFTRHYRAGGIGIKHMADLFVYVDKKPDLDFAYIESELKKLKLYDFYKNVNRTLDCWFKDAEYDETTEHITRSVLLSGAYGTVKKGNLSEAVSREKKYGSSKLSKLIWLIFLPYPYMCLKYPFLKKAPILLPIMWVVRIFTSLVFNRKRVQTNLEDVASLNKDEIDKYRQGLDLVGLDFDY